MGNANHVDPQFRESASDTLYSIPLAHRKPGGAETVADVAAQSDLLLGKPARRAVAALDDPELRGFAKRYGIARPYPPPPTSAKGAAPAYPPGSNVVSGALDAPAPPREETPSKPRVTIFGSYASDAPSVRPRVQTGLNDAFEYNVYSSIDEELPRLPDYSNGRIGFGGEVERLGPRLVLRDTLPGLPLSPASFPSRRSVLQSMSPAQVARQLYQPRLIRDERELQVRCDCLEQSPPRQFCSGWHQLPFLAPFWCSNTGVGTCVVQAWRRHTVEPTVMLYAIRKLFPLGAIPQDRYGQRPAEVYASWGVPLKWAVTAVAGDGQRMLVMDDSGNEFEVETEEIKAARSKPAMHALAVLKRDYPRQMVPLLALRRTEPPRRLLSGEPQRTPGQVSRSAAYEEEEPEEDEEGEEEGEDEEEEEGDRLPDTAATAAVLRGPTLAQAEMRL